MRDDFFVGLHSSTPPQPGWACPWCNAPTAPLAYHEGPDDCEAARCKELREACRKLTVEVVSLRENLDLACQVSRGLAERVASQSELLGRRAEAPRGNCPYRNHHPSCDCKGEGGDR